MASTAAPPAPPTAAASGQIDYVEPAVVRALAADKEAHPGGLSSVFGKCRGIASLFSFGSRRDELVADFGFGSPQEMPPEALVDVFKKHEELVSPLHYGYMLDHGPAGEAVARSLNATHAMTTAPVSSDTAADASTAPSESPLPLLWTPQHVVLTHGSLTSLASVTAAVCGPGDEVVMFNPDHFSYRGDIIRAGGTPVALTLAPPTFELDVDAIVAAITPRTAAVLINTPHNPSGHIVPPETLKRLGTLLARASRRRGRAIFLISDEAYRDLVFDGVAFVSPVVACEYPWVVMTYSMGKCLMIPGRRAGYAALSPAMPEAARKRLRSAITASVMCHWSFPDNVVWRAVPDLLDLPIDVASLQAKRDTLVAALRRMGYTLEVPQSTLYVLVQVPPRAEAPPAAAGSGVGGGGGGGSDGASISSADMEASEAFCDMLGWKHGLITMPGPTFYTPGYFRLCLTAPMDAIKASLPGFEAAIREWSGGAVSASGGESGARDTTTSASNDRRGMGLAQAARAVASGEISSTALVETALAAAAAAQKPPLRAVTSIDADTAREAAAACDVAVHTALEDGTTLPPLHGVPVIVKDNINVAGLPTTMGTKALESFVARGDAPVVAALRAAGAIVIGHSSMTELAVGITGENAHRGDTACAYDASRGAGGSSAGTGAAVAAGVVAAGLGTDTGGSVRIPSAFNGLCGLRPSSGRYPQEGIVPFSHTRDTAGPMARTVADVALMDAVIAGDGSVGDGSARAALEPAELSSLRLGVLSFDSDGVAPEVAASFNAAVARLRMAGVALVQMPMPPEVDTLVTAAGKLTLYEPLYDVSTFLRDNETGVTYDELVAGVAQPAARGMFEAIGKGASEGGMRISEDAYKQALGEREELRSVVDALFASTSIDALIAPTTPMPAVPLGVDGAPAEIMLRGRRVPSFPTLCKFVTLGTVAGLPGVTLPCGLAPPSDDPSGRCARLPVGLALDGPVGSDRKLLAVAAAVEGVLGAIEPPSTAL